MLDTWACVSLIEEDLFNKLEGRTVDNTSVPLQAVVWHSLTAPGVPHRPLLRGMLPRKSLSTFFTQLLLTSECNVQIFS